MVIPGNLYEHVCLQFVLCVRAFVRTDHFLPCNLIRAAVWLNLDLHILPQASKVVFSMNKLLPVCIFNHIRNQTTGEGEGPRKKTTKSERGLMLFRTIELFAWAFWFLKIMFQCCPIICVQYMSWVSRSYIWCKRHSDVYRLRIGPQYVSWLVMAVQQVHESEQEMLFLQVRRLHINIMEKIHAGSYFSISVFKPSQGTGYK